MHIDLDKIFDSTHCCQCGFFIEPENRDFTHLCYRCWKERPDVKQFVLHGQRMGWPWEVTLYFLKMHQYSQMN